MVNLLHRRAHNLTSQVRETNAADGVNKVIQALIELCAGNFNNQSAIINAQVMDGINAVLKTALSTDLQPIQVSVTSVSANQHALHVLV